MEEKWNNQNKLIPPLFLVVLLFLLPSVNALDVCDEPVQPNYSCKILTPEIYCSLYTYKVLNSNGTIIDSGNLTLFNGYVYSFNFSQGQGEYLLYLCDGTTREIIVKEDENNMIALSIIMIFIGGFFLFLGYKNNVWAAKLLGYGVGFLQLVMSLGILYASFKGIDFTDLIYMDLMITLLLGFGLGIYTFVMTTVSTISLDREPGDWGVRWEKK